MFTTVSSDTSLGSVSVMPSGALFLLQLFKSNIFKDPQPVDFFQLNDKYFYFEKLQCYYEEKRARQHAECCVAHY